MKSHSQLGFAWAIFRAVLIAVICTRPARADCPGGQTNRLPVSSFCEQLLQRPDVKRVCDQIADQTRVIQCGPQKRPPQTWEEKKAAIKESFWRSVPVTCVANIAKSFDYRDQISTAAKYVYSSATGWAIDTINGYINPMYPVAAANRERRRAEEAARNRIVSQPNSFQGIDVVALFQKLEEFRNLIAKYIVNEVAEYQCLTPEAQMVINCEMMSYLLGAGEAKAAAGGALTLAERLSPRAIAFLKARVIGTAKNLEAVTGLNLVKVPPNSWLTGIKLDEVQVGKLLGEGTQAKAYLVTVGGQQRVLRANELLRVGQIEEIKGLKMLDLPFSESELKSLANMTLPEAKAYLASLKSMGSDAGTPFLRVKRAVADTLVTAENSQLAKGLIYEGHAVSPAIDTVVRNERGIPIGHIMEKLEGKSFRDLMLEGTIKEEDFPIIERQVRDQLDLLHKNGLVHGDVDGVGGGNILVNYVNGKPVARLVDFDPKTGVTADDENSIFKDMFLNARELYNLIKLRK